MLAGPGTGKTHTLVGRIAHLICQGVPPQAILAVTFTRRAATELEERLAFALPEATPPEASSARNLPRAGTLHALALEQWEAHNGSMPTLLDDDTARRVFAGANAPEPAAELRSAWERISLAREKLTPQTPRGAALLAAYTCHKTAHNLADYTDLLERWLARLDGQAAPSPWVHILVDEIQDLSPLQLRLIVALLPAHGHGFFGIGDPDQSIYSFRGAHGNVQEFLKGTWPGLHTVALTDNYRSPAVILRVASALLTGYAACGPLRPALQAEGRIHLFSAPTAESEAAWVAGHIRRLIGQGSHTLDDAAGQDGAPLLGAGTLSPGDIAVLVRIRALAPVLQQALARLGVDASVPENEGFWKDPRLLPLLEEAHHRLGLLPAAREAAPVQVETAHNPTAFRLAACPEEIFALGPRAVAIWAGEEFFDGLFREAAVFQRLCATFARHGGWQPLLNWIHLQTDRELVRARSERVQIMSIHAAKGLEFKAVFLPALEEGILPFAGSGALSASTVSREKSVPVPPDLSGDVAEERRLLYVGMTRACQSLFLSHAQQRHIFGRKFTAAPSRFLAALPTEDIQRSVLRSRLVHKETQLSLL